MFGGVLMVFFGVAILLAERDDLQLGPSLLAALWLVLGLSWILWRIVGLRGRGV